MHPFHSVDNFRPGTEEMRSDWKETYFFRKAVVLSTFIHVLSDICPTDILQPPFFHSEIQRDILCLFHFLAVVLLQLHPTSTAKLFKLVCKVAESDFFTFSLLTKVLFSTFHSSHVVIISNGYLRRRVGSRTIR
jgi:hypothetical protein